MAQVSGAKEPHSFVANPLLIYDYAYDTEVDLIFFFLNKGNFFHSKLMLKLK
jgi:hypothetical protein